MSAPRTPLTDKTPWSLVFLLGSLTAMGPLAIDMYLPSLPSISADMHAPPAAVSATLAAFFAGLCIGQFFYGPLSDRIGRRPPLIFGMALFVAGAVGCALAPTPEWLILARFIQALGGSAGQVVARASVRDRFHHQMSARVLSLLMLVVGLAPIIAPIFGGYLLVVADWRAIFWFQAVLSAAIGVWMLIRLDESRPEAVLVQSHSEHVIAAYWALLKQPRVVGYTLSGAFNAGAFFSWLAFSPYVLMTIYGVSKSNFGWLFGLNAAGFIIMSQVNAHLLRWFTPEEVLVRARAASIVFAAVLVFNAVTGFGGMIGFLIPLYITMASFGLVGPNTQAAAMNVDPTRIGSTSSLTGGASFGMGALISSAAGLLHDGTVRPLAYLILVMIVLSSLALYLLAKPMETKHEHHSS